MPSPRPCPKASEDPSPEERGGPFRCQIFLDKLPLIERLIRSVSRRFRLSPEQSEDFRSTVLLGFIEDDYALLRDFRRESQWSTYLTTLIRNRCRDFLIEIHGRWQYSKASKSAGSDLMQLEMLWRRDGFELDEAIELLVRNGSSRQSREKLHTLAEGLPQRQPRSKGREEQLFEFPGNSLSDCRLDTEERGLLLHQVHTTLHSGLRKLQPEERSLLQWQYARGESLTDYAKLQGIRRRKVYTLHARCLRRLRKEFEKAGITTAEVRQILGWDNEESLLSSVFESGRPQRDRSLFAPGEGATTRAERRQGAPLEAVG